jgi:hypothetical protein
MYVVWVVEAYLSQNQTLLGDVPEKRRVQWSQGINPSHDKTAQVKEKW